MLFVGGVASNGIIRKLITENINGRAHFASREYSTDNALGTALLAKRMAENK